MSQLILGNWELGEESYHQESTLISAFQSLERRDFFQGPVTIRPNFMNIGNQITKLASPCTGDISERNLFDF